MVMPDRKRRRPSNSGSWACVIVLSVFLGLILGTILAFFADISYPALMRVALEEHVSIVMLLASLLLPISLCVIAVLLSASWLLPVICFARCLSFSFVSMCMFLAFDGIGWFLRWLLMFGHIASLPILIWFCLKHRKGNAKGLMLTLISCVSVLALAGSVDYSISILLRQLRL